MASSTRFGSIRSSSYLGTEIPRTMLAQGAALSRLVEIGGFEPPTFRMRTERSTTELYPHVGRCGSPLYTERLLRFAIASDEAREVNQLDTYLFRRFDDTLIAIELTVTDALDAGVAEELEAGPARAGGDIDG